jgi:anaphase-promoting complex subunit 4
LSIPIRKIEQNNLSNHSENSIRYFPHVENGSSPSPTVLNNEEVLQRFSKSESQNEGSFVAGSMAVRDQNNNEDMRRLVLLGKDELHYRILKLADSNSGRKRADEDVSMS